MDGYTVSEAASVLGVSTERVWELLARGVLAGEPEGQSGMRVFLQPRPGSAAPPAPAPDGGASPQRPNGHDGELSPFRELLTEFRNLTERYGQALLALGEARGEVASLRGRVELLEARIDLRLPPVQVPPSRRAAWDMTAPEEVEVPQAASAEAAEAMAEPEEAIAQVEPKTDKATAAPRPARRERAPKKPAKRQARARAPRRAGLAEALARAEDPALASLPGGREAAEALAAFQQAEAAEAEPVAAEPAVVASATEEPGVETPVDEPPSPDAPVAVAEPPIDVEVEPWEPAPASELLVAEEPLAAGEEAAASAEPIATVEGEAAATEAIEAVPEPVEVAAPEPVEVTAPEPVEVAAPEPVEAAPPEPSPLEPGAAPWPEPSAPSEPREEAAVEPMEVEAMAPEEAAVEESTASWDQGEPLPAESPYTAQLAEPDWFSDADLAAAGDQGYPVADVTTDAEAGASTWDRPETPAPPAEWESAADDVDAGEEWAREEPTPDFAAAWTPMPTGGEASPEEEVMGEASAPMTTEVEAAEVTGEALLEEGQSEVAIAAEEAPTATIEPVDQIAPPAEPSDQGPVMFASAEQDASAAEPVEAIAPAAEPPPIGAGDEPSSEAPVVEGAWAYSEEMAPTIESTEEIAPGVETPSMGAGDEIRPEAAGVEDTWAYSEQPFEPEGMGEPAFAEPEVGEPEAMGEPPVSEWSVSEPQAAGDPALREQDVGEPSPSTVPEVEPWAAAEPEPSPPGAYVEPAAEPAAPAPAQAPDLEAEEEQVMWLGDAEEPASYAEEMEVATGTWHEPWADTGPQAPAEIEEAPAPPPATGQDQDVARGGEADQPPPTANAAAVPDDIYVEGWRAESRPAAAAGTEGGTQSSTASPPRASTGSRELDEGLAALDALARMAAAKRTARNQPLMQQEPPLTGDEIVQRLRSQYAAQRGAGRGRPEPPSTPPASGSQGSAAGQESAADPTSGRIGDQRSPAARAYRRLRRIFPG